MPVRSRVLATIWAGAVAAALLVFGHARLALLAQATPFILDDFEAGTIFQVQPAETQQRNRDLWNLYTDFDFIGNVPIPGLSNTDIVTSTAYSGTHALHNHFAQSLQPQAYGSNWQFEYFTFTSGLSPTYADRWHFLYQVAQASSPASYVTNTYNRLRFWIKVPVGSDVEPLAPGDDGRHNVEFGTHIRELSETFDGESNNWHFYHFYSLYPSEGEWEQVIVDTYPQAQRSHPGDEDYPDQLHLSAATPNLNYWDLMTRFYVDWWDKIRFTREWPTPTDFYMDKFELFQETFATENIRQVSSIHGVYLPSSNTIRVGWCRVKAEESIPFDIRYSFNSVYDAGWASATPAPGGTGIAALVGSGPYSTMRYSTTGITMGTHDAVYIAIKPQNADDLHIRQIRIPVAASGPPPPPGPVGSLLGATGAGR